MERAEKLEKYGKWDAQLSLSSTRLETEAMIRDALAKAMRLVCEAQRAREVLDAMRGGK